MKSLFEWDDELKVATCIIKDKYNNVFTGIATCHPDDVDMCSKYTGQEIAFLRCRIDVLKFHKERIKNELKGLKKVYNMLQNYKRFNPEHFESKYLKKEIEEYKIDLINIKELINEEKQELKNFIDNKELLYQKLRKKNK